MERGSRSGPILWVALYAALLGIVHLGAAGLRHESRLADTRAHDAASAAQAGEVRESVLHAFGNNPGLDRDVRAAELAEALKLREGPGGITAQREAALKARARSEALALMAGEVELAEAGLQLAILLATLGIALERRPLLRAGQLLAVLALIAATVALVDLALG